MKNTIALLLVLFAVTGLSAQEKESKFDVKFGTGMGFMGYGDMITISFENELNYKINRYFAASVSIGYGKGDWGVHIHTDYLMASGNLFFSPFRNNRRNNFKIGAGGSLFNHTNFYESAWYSESGPVYDFYRIRTTGFNVIVEDEYRVHSNLLIGGKLFMTAGIQQGGILSGGMLKVGFIL